jgi:hypothetical protein
MLSRFLFLCYDAAMRYLVASLLLLGLAAPARADTPAPSPSPTTTPAVPSDPCGSISSIVTRPSVTTSVCTVRAHHVLLENGWQNTTVTGPGGGAIANYPQSYARLGSSDSAVEYDFTPPSAERSSTGGTVAGGVSDVGGGMKWELGYGARWSYGANFAVTFPTGSHAFTAGAPQYTGNFNWGYTVNPTISLAGTVGVNSLAGFGSTGSVQRYLAVIPSLDVEFSLPASTSAFVEYAYFSQAGIGLGGKSLIDGGISHDFGPNVQADAEYGDQLTTLLGQRQHYIGAGLSFIF